PARYRAVVVDWGGVLTAPLQGAWEAWADADGVDLDHFGQLLAHWRELARGEAGTGPDAGPVAALERGEITTAEFETRVADELGRLGSPVSAAGLLGRMLAGLEERDEEMFAVLHRARSQGVKLALLSNSWGNTYDRRGWQDLFHAVVISGEVGMRKPEARIFRHACAALGMEPEACVMVDDLPWNIEAAAEVGMGAVLHTSAESTALELERLLAVALR
ncbi:MAG: HAD family hydrolase, partial [Actinomycetes bacterium]